MGMKSNRHDGRGHWPAGKRRNQDGGTWGRTRLALSRFIEDEFRPGEISRSALAKELGVSDRTVRRWLSGEDRPTEVAQDAISQWLVEWRAELKARRK